MVRGAASSGGPAPELALALSPLLGPLRFLGRAGLGRLSALRELEPLVASVASSAQAFAPSAAAALATLPHAIAGFDAASDAARRAALGRLLDALGALLPLPADLATLQAELAGPRGQPHQSPPGRPLASTPGRPVAHPPAPAARQPQRQAQPRGAPLPPPEAVDPLLTPLTQLRGVGPAMADKLAGRGLRTVQDLLLELPRRYEDRRSVRAIADAPMGERSLIAARVVRATEPRARRGRRLEVVVADEDGAQLSCIWFHFRGSLTRTLVPGARVLLSGEVKIGYRGQGKAMHHPDVEVLAEGRPVQEWLGADPTGRAPGDDSFGRVVPVYTEVEGVPARTYRRLVHAAVDGFVHLVPDSLPAGLLARRKLLSLPVALRESHFPDRFAEEAASGRPGEPRRRLAFEELFLVQLGLALRRRGVKIEPGIAFHAAPHVLDRIVGDLPWPLTGAQRRAVQAIAADMRRPEPMNRLLQGDVGSGKTAVALAAALLAVEDGYQAAIMAPTELLAEQHALSLRALLGKNRVQVELVTGALSTRERGASDRRLRSGASQIVVGTHALAEESTAFHRLGLVVIDEQHRFGVMTRARLMSKGHRPDVLVMTATPIPRTLALTLYGDLDSSVLDELPPGRTPVATRVIKDADRDKAYRLVRRELEAGRQAYVVLPLVTESEKLTDLKAAVVERERLSAEVFPDVPIGLVHGRQTPAERQLAMERFRSGKDRILVATTVIEVGVDVPNATVMLIEHAERFGLSQLHQLRGRVGRGAAKSLCLLVTGSSGAEWGPIARERLAVMEKTTDGFRIAEADLELRGPGEFLGTRQSGLPDFSVAELARDQAILAEAREEAFALVAADPDLKSAENAPVREQLRHRWQGRLSLARVG